MKKHYFLDEHSVLYLPEDLLHAMFEINNDDLLIYFHQYSNLKVELFLYIYLMMLRNVLVFYDHLHPVMELL